MNSWLSTTSNWLKKQYFNSAHYIDILANQGEKLSEGDIYLFGIKFDKENRKQAFQIYQSVLWFTYRDNIRFEGYPNVISDVGWGCMMRVGQMMLAQALRIQKGPLFYSDQKWLSQLINEFILEDGQFSIERLAKIGGKVIEKQPGQWYSSYDIAVVLKNALQNNTQPVKKSYIEMQPLEIIISTAQFSLKQVYSQTKIIKKSQPDIFAIRPCLLIVICRLGFQKPEEQHLRLLIQFLKNEKNCIGILGGRPGKAHYIFGTTQKSFIYLDPHCVKNQLNIESFLCQTLFSMTHDKIDPSLGLCFYLANFKQMMFTHQRLRLMKCSQLIYCHQFQMFNCMSLEIQGDHQEEVYQILE